VRGSTEVLQRIQLLRDRVDRLDVAAILLTLAYFVFLYNYVNLQIPIKLPISPDENSLLITAQRIIENGSFSLTSPLNERYGVKVFVPREFTEVAPNTFVTIDSPGFAIFLAVANWLHILPFIIPMTAMLGMLAIYRMISVVFEKRAGILVAAMMGALPNFVFFSNTYFDSVPSFSFLMLSAYFFFKYLRTSKTWRLETCVFFLALSIFLRPYNALFVVGYVGVIAMLRKRLSLKSVVIGTASFLFFLAPLLILNEYVYQDPFRVGYVSPGSLDALTSQKFGLDTYWAAFVYHVILLAPLVSLLAFFGAIIIVLSKRNMLQGAFYTFLTLLSLAAFLAFGSLSRTYGFYEAAPYTALGRYLMPVYLLLACCAYSFVKRLIDLRMKRLSILLVSVVMISLIASNLAANALPLIVLEQNRYSGIRQVIQSLPTNSVIFTREYDKVIFPLRDVALVYTNSDLSSNPDLKYAVPIVDIDHDLIPLIHEMLLDGFHVFLAPDVDDLAARLVQAGFYIEGNQGYGFREVFLPAASSIVILQTSFFTRDFGEVNLPARLSLS